MREFYVTFVRKMPEFYMIIARKIFFPIFFRGMGQRGHVPPSPVSYAYAHTGHKLRAVTA